MNIAFKDLGHAVRDRDWLTIAPALFVVASWYFFDLDQKTILLEIILCVIVRALSIQRSKDRLDLQYDAIMQKMNKIRNESGFQNGLLSHVFSCFPKLNRRIKEQCIVKLLSNGEIIRDTTFNHDDYIFYRHAVNNKSHNTDNLYSEF